MKAMKLLPASALLLIVLLTATLFIQVAKADSPTTPDLFEICIPTDGTLADIPAPTHEIQVLRSSTCLEIDAREPAESGTQFEIADGRVYCFSEIQCPKGDPHAIKHVWKHEGKVVSSVSLQILGPTYRTWSYKTLGEGHAGKWTVEVQTASGDILDSNAFTID